MRNIASRLLRARSVTFAVLALTLAGSAGLLFGSSTDVAAAGKWTVFAGGGRAGISVDLFRPDVINVNVGDTVEFVNPFEEIHTVTFTAGKPLPEFIEAVPNKAGPPTITINPEASTVVKADKFDGTKWVNSGVMGKNDKFSVTYPVGGSFQFICIVHPWMTATVNVLPEGTFVASQAQRDAEAAGTLESIFKIGEAAAASMKLVSTPGAGGSTNYKMTFPAPFGNPPAPIAVNRFSPSRISINVGDSVTWDNNVEGPPHTVTFLGGTPAPMGFAVPDSKGVLSIPPNIAFPTPQKTYDGVGYANSGIIQKSPGSPPSYTLTFTKAGSYPYICILHADQGMAGVIEVGGASGAGAGGSGTGGGFTITPPQTGDAGLSGDNASMTPWLLAAAGVLVFGLGGIAVAKAKLN